VDDEPRKVDAGPLTARLEAVQAKARERGYAEPEPVRMYQPTPEDQERTRWQRWAPQKFHAAELGTLDPDGRAIADDWLADPTVNLILSGPVGVGKTHLAFAICRKLLTVVGRVSWWPTVELLDALRPSDDGAVDMRGLVEERVLMLDDLGGERASDWTRERLYSLINRRWMEERPLIVTVNTDTAGLVEAIGERSVDRLLDGAVSVRLAGASRRERA